MIEGQDRRLLTHLQKDGRRSNQDLADDVGMSSSACWRRVRALEEKKELRRISVEVDPILEVTEFGLAHYPQTGEDSGPSYYTSGYPQALREAYLKQWHKEHDPEIGKEPMFENYVFRGNDFDAGEAGHSAANRESLLGEQQSQAGA